MADNRRRVVLVDPESAAREVLAGRLSAQSFDVQAFGDPAQAANWTLDNPPDALIADVWMPGVSGVQLCRLLKSEPATEHLPIVLRAVGDAPKARFWSEQAGAAAYVPRGRIGELVRALERAIADAPASTGFFTQLAQTDVRDRIAQHLDRALFESVIASSVRALGTCESFGRLFDLFSQFVSRVTPYRWLAVVTDAPARWAVHCHPETSKDSVQQAAGALGIAHHTLTLIQDEDAGCRPVDLEPLVQDVRFGTTTMGRVAIQPLDCDADVARLLDLIAAELGGPLRIASLVEESQRLAHYDPLTGIMNRRAFVERLSSELERARDHGGALSFMLLDVDHFKAINDTHGHKAGDRVLEEMGRLIPSVLPPKAAVARWGGEEFVVFLPGLTRSEALLVAERLRGAVEQREIQTDKGLSLSVTVSIGVADMLRGEPLESLVERADHAMYSAKVSGRNQVQIAAEERRSLPTSLRVPAPAGNSAPVHVVKSSAPSSA